MTSKNQTKQDKIVVSAPVTWRIPDGISTPFATHMLIQTLENEFKISFFEIKPPVVFDGTNSREIKEVFADYTTGVIVSPQKLRVFIKTLQEHLDKYNNTKD